MVARVLLGIFFLSSMKRFLHPYDLLVSRYGSGPSVYFCGTFLNQFSGPAAENSASDGLGKRKHASVQHNLQVWIGVSHPVHVVDLR